ncbi:MAG: ACT domain-containing protein [Aggregatilineales bacterium]
MAQAMDAKLKEVLQTAPFFCDEQDYILVHLPQNAVTAAAAVLAEIRDPFGALIIDKDEVTLVLQRADLDDYTRRLPDHRVSSHAYRLITIDLPLDPSLIGLFAAISQQLAAARIPILALSAFSRDHILVPAAQIDAALEALNSLRSSAH